MKTGNIRWGRAIIAGLLTGVIDFLVGFVLYGSVNGVYQSFGDLPYAKPITSIPIYLLEMVLGGLALCVLWALIYVIIQEGLPGRYKWQKGLVFGLILIAIKVLPAAFNTWTCIPHITVEVSVAMCDGHWSGGYY